MATQISNHVTKQWRYQYKVFPPQTVQRHSHLWVATLKDDTGLWLNGEPLTQHINNTFKKLFQATSPHLRPTSRNTMQCIHRSPFLVHAHSLAGVPPPTEILRNLRNLPLLKAPEPDGYHAFFFQHNWYSLDPSIV